MNDGLIRELTTVAPNSPIDEVYRYDFHDEG